MIHQNVKMNTIQGPPAAAPNKKTDLDHWHSCILSWVMATGLDCWNPATGPTHHKFNAGWCQFPFPRLHFLRVASIRLQTYICMQVAGYIFHFLLQLLPFLQSPGLQKLLCYVCKYASGISIHQLSNYSYFVLATFATCTSGLFPAALLHTLLYLCSLTVWYRWWWLTVMLQLISCGGTVEPD